MFAKFIDEVQHSQMGMIANEINLKSLLTPPPTFERNDFASHLYTPYSLKLHRRAYLYTHNGYDLWVLLESSPDIIEFNERVVPVPISLEDGRIVIEAPAAISVSEDEQVVVHTFQSTKTHDAVKVNIESTAWKRWCNLHGFMHKEWNSKLLQSNPVELSNLKRLLRFVSCAGYVPNLALEKSLMCELQNVRKITFAKLVQLFPISDPDDVQQSLARLIISHKVYSDIHLFPLSMITEVSAYHEFIKN